MDLNRTDPLEAKVINTFQRRVVLVNAMGDIIIEDEETAQKREKQQGLERTIEEAKWDMYAERWDLAEKQLQEARETAIRLRDKDKIDVILELLGKCKAKEKVELGK